jgi:ADP-heptose:LPS heptosyltransferase
MKSSFRQGAEAWLAKYIEASLNAILRVARRCLWPGRRPTRAQRVCIYRIGNLGDILCALPAMHSVRKAYPEARLTLLTSPGPTGLSGAPDLLANAAWLYEVLVYHSEEIDTVGQKLQLLKKLRQRRFDVWIELSSSLATAGVILRNMGFARLAGARWGQGWTISTIRWAARAQSRSRVFPNEVERLLRVVARCGIRTEHVSFPLPLRDHHAAAIDALLPGAARWVALAPGAKRPANRWPLDRYAALGRELSRRGFFVLLLGGAEEGEACNLLAAEIGSAVLNLAGRLSVLESCELLRRCAFLVCNDSGVQHMAAAVSTPCVSLFAAREMPGKWHPYGARNVVLRKDVACHSCYRDECPQGNLCLGLIQVPEVLRATELLQASRNSGQPHSHENRR